MQEQSAEMCSRLRVLHTRLQKPWAEIAALLTLSQSMVYQVLSGKRELSNQALFRLGALESEYGITEARAAISGQSEQAVVETAIADDAKQRSRLAPLPRTMNDSELVGEIVASLRLYDGLNDDAKVFALTRLKDVWAHWWSRQYNATRKTRIEPKNK